MYHLVDYLNSALKRGTYNSQYIMLAGMIGLIGHPLYWAIWVYLFPQPYESPLLRFSSAVLCLPLALVHFWSSRLKQFLPAYWHFTLLYILPFTFTYLMLQNEYSTVWLLCYVVMIVLLIQSITETVWFIIVLTAGSLAGATLFTLEKGSISFDAFSLEYIPIFLFMLLVGMLLQYLVRMGIRDLARERERNRIFKALSGSIAHEVRTPVAGGHQSAEFLRSVLSDVASSLKDNEALKPKMDFSIKTTENIKHTLNRGSMVINLILRNIREEPVDPSSFVMLDIKSVTEKALAEYAFQPGERDKIVADLDDSFEFKGDEGLVVFIIFNLLRNALFYAADATLPITITADAAHRTLAVKDHGPGVPKDKLKTIFDSFVTAGNKQGTGLGLAFCKRGMTDMGGSIHCNSELNQYTEFVLKFAPWK